MSWSASAPGLQLQGRRESGLSTSRPSRGCVASGSARWRVLLLDSMKNWAEGQADPACRVRKGIEGHRRGGPVCRGAWSRTSATKLRSRTLVSCGALPDLRRALTIPPLAAQRGSIQWTSQRRSIDSGSLIALATLSNASLQLLWPVSADSKRSKPRRWRSSRAADLTASLITCELVSYACEYLRHSADHLTMPLQ